MLAQDKNKAQTAGFLVVPKLDDAVAYYQRVFGASETERYEDRKGKVWYAVIHLYDIPVQLMEPFPSMGLFAAPPVKDPANDTSLLIVHTPKVDSVYSAAIKSGATSITAPQYDSFDGVRFADLRDPFGHRWQLRLDQNQSVQPGLFVPNVDKALQFHAVVFGAIERARVVHPIDKRTRSTLTVGTGVVHLIESSPKAKVDPVPPATPQDSAMVALTLANVDATFAAALKNGATPVINPHDAYWGDRYAEFRLPEGPRVATCDGSGPTTAVKSSNANDIHNRFTKFLGDNNNPLSPAEVLGDKVLGDTP